MNLKVPKPSAKIQESEISLPLWSTLTNCPQGDSKQEISAEKGKQLCKRAELGIREVFLLLAVQRN